MNASGLGYYDRGNYAMAAQEFQTAVASNPKNPDYLANFARTRMKMGDLSGAEQLYQQALAISPSHQPAYHGYSELLLAQNRGQDALRMMNSWAATQPYIPESHVELAWVQRELGQHDAAAQSLQTALQMNPNHATALAHLGQYYQDQGNSTQAVAMYQQALRADWNQPEVHSRLAMAAESAGASHPMGEMAMARGVHPHSLPRQQLAFGNPFPHQLQNPAYPHQQVAWQQPQPGGVPQQWQPITQGAQLNPGQGVPFQPAAPTAGFNPMPPFGVAASSSVSGIPPADQPAPLKLTESSNPPLPVPDPEFNNGNSIPVTSVSNAVELESATPEVEAF